MKSFLLISTLAAALLSSCGGGDLGTTPANPQASNATVQINLGDAPADSLLAVGMTVNGVSLTRAGAGPVAVLSSPRPMEMMQWMGTVSPLATASVPQGTYSGITMTFGAATITYVDAATGQILQKTVPGPMTGNVTFDPPLAVGSTPMVLNVDMNMGASVTIGSGGSVSMTPSLSAMMNPAVAGSHDPEDGGMHGLMGMVSGLGNGTFTMTMMQGLSGVSLAANSGTQFSGINGMGAMAGNMLVSVDAALQPDGSWIATRVQSRMGPGGAMAAGLVTELTGTPPTQLVLVMQAGIGAGMMPANLAGTMTVNIDDGTQFSVDDDGVDLGSLPFTPRFDRSSISKGQRVASISIRQMMQGGGMGGMTGGSTLAAASIRLEEQGLRGVVSSISASGSPRSFTLTLPADSAFTRLTGASTVTVYQQGGTQVHGLTPVANGSAAQVRGLLFLDGGVFRFIASRIVVI